MFIKESCKIALRFYQMSADFWLNGKIQKILKMSTGYSWIVLYLQLLSLSIKHHGYIFWRNEYKSIIEQLEEDLYPYGGNFQEIDINAALRCFLDFKLVEIVDLKNIQREKKSTEALKGGLWLTQFDSLTSQDGIKLLSNKPEAIRQRKSRKKKALIASKSANSIRQANYRSKKRKEAIEIFKKQNPDIVLNENNITSIAAQLHMRSTTLAKLWDINSINERRVKNGQSTDRR